MAQLLKRADSEGKKGIVLISHRELPFLQLAERLNLSCFKTLSDNFKIILHIGWYHQKFYCPKWLDCLITSPSNLGEIRRNGACFRNICSRDVLPSEFSLNQKDSKRYDCVYICNNSRNKRAREFFELVKAMPDKKFAFVLSYPDNADPVKFDSRLPAEIRQYQESLGDKSNLDFFDAKHTESGYALSRSDIAGILNQSKIYVHMCRREGESRSLGEALACGCHLALHSDFVGGATDICNKDNSIRFSTSSDLETQIRSVLESGVDSEKNAAEYAEIRSRTLIQLRSLLREYGMDQTEIDELFLQDLSMVLPGHTSPQFPRAKYTGNADITDINEFCGFLKLCGIEVEPSKLRFFEFALRMRSLLVNLAQSIKSRKVF